jgi:hypothetical protein
MSTRLDPPTNVELAFTPDTEVRPAWFLLYGLAIALWAGGTAIFTFLVTPAIFRSFNRDLAGEIVGRMFPLYFPYVLGLSAMALVAFLAATRERSGAASRLSLSLLLMALAVNCYVSFKLYPDVLAVKRQVTSFEREVDSPARRRFAQLHGLSAALNLLVVADGLALVLLLPAVGRSGDRRS